MICIHDSRTSRNKIEEVEIPDLVPMDQWEVYECVMREAEKQGLRFAVGGALALGVYTNRWRNTKDIDLYVLPEDREQMIAVYRHCGLTDYYDKVPYDRRWIYRGFAERTNTIVDAIWSMANMRAEVDERWLTAGKRVSTRGISFRILPAEELIWSKLYVMQRERCDWPDILNMFYAMANVIDWRHLMRRVGDDAPLLKSVLSIFAWMCPSCAESIPDSIRMQLDLTSYDAEMRPMDARRVGLLDGRPWFGPNSQAA